MSTSVKVYVSKYKLFNLYMYVLFLIAFNKFVLRISYCVTNTTANVDDNPPVAGKN